MSDTDKIREVFAAIRNDLGPVDVLVYSASSRFKAQGSQGNIEVCTEEDMERAWKIDTLGNWEILCEAWLHIASEVARIPPPAFQLPTGRELTQPRNRILADP